MDKKVAIVTWHTNPNYGGVLQAYALQEVLESLGYDSEFINYFPERHRLSRKLSRVLKDCAILASMPKVYLSRKGIHEFVRNNLKVSPTYATYNQLRSEASKRYSAAICGSDQIWSNIGGYVNPLFYLTFIDEKRRIAYAPSIGYDHVPPDCAATFREYVDGIRFLSVRESQGAALIKEIVGRDSKVVLDPSMLLTKKGWEAKAHLADTMSLERPYIFCYFRCNNRQYVEYARRLSKCTGWPLISVDTSYPSLRGIRRLAANPFDFVWLINNASYVLTDAFHGTAFSINLGKQFGVFKRFHDNDPIGQNSRVHNILEKTQLESRLITFRTPIDFLVEEKIDYDSVDPLLDSEREESLTYLASAISAVTNA